MRITKLLKEFLDSEKAGGLVLLACTIISLIIANSNWGEPYTSFWHRYVDLSVGSISLKYSIEHWINDGLMAIFFLLVGLEIERELYIGELKDLKVAALPIAAAIGGMLVPAAIHFLFNNGSATQPGFGIPMATDIAFALGMLSLLGNRVPYSLKIFLTALAIIDDLGAILVIAVFYNDGISWIYLLSALGIFAGLFILGKLKVYNLLFYVLPGIVMWYCMLKSGVHATITGVLLAFAIPFGGTDYKSPSYRLQHFLHKPVAFVILPIFALANTGLILSDGWINELTTNNNLGIILGLVIGKPVGIILFCFLLIQLKWGSLPSGIKLKDLTGAGILGGIGFTMSIFISNLAFKNAETIQFSKVSVLIASSIACVAGLIWLAFSLRRNQEELSVE
ncbi:Na+/H+ antiporter NhaA [Terrimonas pollutisoli]|uniref:Na+/H+ antiporter NhaA n=1 Tax=Terrimonas pollutisoli TaxID=3034147 RepID=UPI0023EDC892|nr:Na+/H+ antiporter NhaA [Terrimonas sp. H1YJ31]